MQFKRAQIFLPLILLCATVNVRGQNSADPHQVRYQRALQEIESVIAEAGKLNDPLMAVTVKAKAASLIWRSDSKRARTMFLELWREIDGRSGESFDRDAARTVLLKYLFPKDSNLATRLLKDLSEQQSEKASLRSQATGNDPQLRRLAEIAAGLVEQDATTAARLLEQSLSIGVTPTALSVLARLRESNPVLANYVVSQALEHLQDRPTIVALTGLHLLTAYVFPQEYPAASAGSASSDDALRFQYFSTAYAVLKRSLEETATLLTKEKGYTQSDLRFRAIYQGQMAAILAVMAPRFGSTYAGELAELARRLAGGLPPNVARLSEFMQARIKGEPTSPDDPEAGIAIAIANGEFDEARRLIDKVEDKERKKAFLQLLAKAEFNARLAEPDLSEALRVARRVEDINLRALLFLQVAKAAYRKDDLNLSRSILSEARSVLTGGEKNGLRARVLLSLASEVSLISESDAIELLHNAGSVINSLPEQDTGAESSLRSNSELAAAEINSPRSFADAPELQRGFASVARADFDGTLIAAAKINAKPVQLMARLAASEIALTKSVKPSKPAPAKKTGPAAANKQGT